MNWEDVAGEYIPLPISLSEARRIETNRRARFAEQVKVAVAKAMGKHIKPPGEFMPASDDDNWYDHMEKAK